MTKGKVIPVLNDWDLSVIADRSNNVGEYTGTIPFLASDLLSSKYWKGEVEVLYRHDLESFVWILLWVFVCYRNGKETVPTGMRGWQTANYASCKGARFVFLQEFENYPMPPEWTTEWPILSSLHKWLYDKSIAFAPPNPEPRNKTVWEEFTGLLREAGKSRGLEYLLDLPL